MNETELPDRTEVTIIGGGVMGTSAAYFLSTTTDYDITLIEKDQIGSGSSGDSSAIIRHHYGPKRIYSTMAKWSHEFFKEFEAQTGQPIAYESNPMVRFAEAGTASGDYVDGGFDVLRSLGLPTSRITGDELADKYPMFDLSSVDFAVSDESAGYSDGTDVAGGFARAAQSAGARVITDLGADDIIVEEGTVQAVMTEQGSLSTDIVLITAGPWTGEIATSIGVDVPITPSREQVLILDPAELFQRKSLTDLPTGGPPGGDWYLRPDFGGGVLVATHHSGEQANPDHYKQIPDEVTILNLTDKLREFVPGLADAGIKGEYCGIYSTTPDHDFIIDSAGPEGCYLGCGFSGHGFKHAPAVGRILRDLIADGGTDLVDVDYFSLDRFEESNEGHGRPADKI